MKNFIRSDRSGRADPEYVLKEIAIYLAMIGAPSGPFERSIPGKNVLIRVDAAGVLCVSDSIAGRVVARSAPGDITRLAIDFKPSQLVAKTSGPLSQGPAWLKKN